MSTETDAAQKALEVAAALFAENAEDFEAQVRNATKAQAMATLGIGWSLLAIAQQLDGAKPIRTRVGQ